MVGQSRRRVATMCVLWAAAVAFVWVFAGCGGGGGGDDGGGADAGTDGGQCTSDVDCDDGTYCNGVETCDPSSADADELGCVTPDESPCLDSQSCDEAASRCVSDCEVEADADGDGHDAVECDGDDCDDSDANRYPGNTEVCDAGDTDEDCDPTTFGDTDADGDGAVDAACCNVSSGGTMTCGGDCDDAEATVHPDSTELCDARDNDCDGEVDEGGELQTYYRDADGDGRGTTLMTLREASCTPPDGYVDNSDDCDDANADTYVGADELCDRVDNDCGEAGSPGGVQTEEDADEDGHAPTDGSCEGGPLPKDDCDDGNPDTYFGATEICDRIDNDCGETDSPGGVQADEDMDDDGYAPLGATCTGGREKLDCDDTMAAVNPDAGESCNGIDDNCDGIVDGGEAAAADCGADKCIGGACGAVADLTAGGAHTCVSSDLGYVSCWGANDRGQVGDGGSTDALTAVPVSGLTDVAAIAAGGEHTCAVSTDGLTMWCWGANGRGQLGDGTTTDRSAPVEVSVSLAAGEVIFGIGAGRAHTCAIIDDDSITGTQTRLECWGANGHGQVGDGTTTDRATPVAITFGGSVQPIRALLGAEHSCVTSEGGVYCWGANAYGQLNMMTSGADVTSPTPTDELDASAGAVTVGAHHGCAYLGSGAEYVCWGRSDRDQLGAGSPADYSDILVGAGLSATPEPEFSESGAGDAHSCARVNGTTVYCWGANDRGQIGIGTFSTEESTPTDVFGDGGRSLTVGGKHTCSATDEGHVYCWGANDRGQIGNDSTADVLSPLFVEL